MTIKFLDLGSNIVEFVNRPVSCPISYRLLDEPEGDLPMFTIEDSNQGLLLKTELRDADNNIIVKISKNIIEKLNNKDYKVEGVIGIGNDFKVARTDNGAVIFNLKADNDSVKVTGSFFFMGQEIEITPDKVCIKPMNCSFWGNRIKSPGNRCITLSQFGFAL
ncbi:hypothetical protein [Methanosarcina sp.]|uniref:hypothetical protein n=1 Tax=Methanosarcina sp. TaxID=2213 RepID=UPI002ABB0707|nr:hypothetical protein [Methanosarcina sp.]MDY9924827.1 hypothetical protein [Methanosarcina sp.]